jgi:hypothetical protein
MGPPETTGPCFVPQTLDPSRSTDNIIDLNPALFGRRVLGKNTLATRLNISILFLAQWPAASETRILNPATPECYTKAIRIDGLRAELECREQRVRETDQSRSAIAAPWQHGRSIKPNELCLQHNRKSGRVKPLRADFRRERHGKRTGSARDPHPRGRPVRHPHAKRFRISQQFPEL